MAAAPGSELPELTDYSQVDAGFAAQIRQLWSEKKPGPPQFVSPNRQRQSQKTSTPLRPVKKGKRIPQVASRLIRPYRRAFVETQALALSD